MYIIIIYIKYVIILYIYMHTVEISEIVIVAFFFSKMIKFRAIKNSATINPLVKYALCYIIIYWM